MRKSVATPCLLVFGLLVAIPAAARQTQAQTKDSDPPTYQYAGEAKRKIGEKTYKQRINTVARKPRQHDIKWLDSADRTSHGDHRIWHGIRDERPLIARKTLGFKDKRPHRTRRERVLLISRGPIQGPGFDE